MQISLFEIMTFLIKIQIVLGSEISLFHILIEISYLKYRCPYSIRDISILNADICILVKRYLYLYLNTDVSI